MILKFLDGLTGWKGYLLVGGIALAAGLASGGWGGMQIQKGLDASTISDITAKYNAEKAAKDKLVVDYNTLDLKYKEKLGTATIENQGKGSTSKEKRDKILDDSKKVSIVPVTGCPAFALNESTVSTINQLLEVSNETGFYSSVVPTAIGVRDLQREVGSERQAFGSPFLRDRTLLTFAETRSESEVHGLGIEEVDQHANNHPRELRGESGCVHQDGFTDENRGIQNCKESIS